jgi:hypothetical protein
MTRFRGSPERRTFYISCTDEQWAEAKERAAADGMKTSPWLVERALNADLSIFDVRPEPQRLALSPNQQHWMADDIGILTNTLEQLFNGKAIEGLGDKVAFIRDAKVAELVASGRFDELFLACEKLFGPERAERLLAKAVRERHGAGSVEVIVGGPKRRE